MRAFSQYNYIINFLKKSDKREGNVLEVGPGYGYLLYYFKKNGFNILGLEYNHYMIKKAKELLGLEFKNMSIYELDVEKKFDVILFSHVLEHFTDPISLLSKCKSLLRDNGVIFIEVPDSPLIKDITKEELFEYLNTIHIYNFKPKSLKLLFEKTNFKIISIDKFLYYMPTVFKKNEKEISWAMLSGEIPNSLSLFLQTIFSFSLMLGRFVISMDPFRGISLDYLCDSRAQFIRLIARKT
jgi:2-polyprenyl-3-methyl-5-hydroxy-6-metoxy-1,4-benzoquinol methylase